MAACRLTKNQLETITKKIEFSVHARMEILAKGFPSCKFIRTGSNGGVTYYYQVSGPRVWVEKIERKYAYGC